MYNSGLFLNESDLTLKNSTVTAIYHTDDRLLYIALYYIMPISAVTIEVYYSFIIIHQVVQRSSCIHNINNKSNTFYVISIIIITWRQTVNAWDVSINACYLLQKKCNVVYILFKVSKVLNWFTPFERIL